MSLSLSPYLNFAGNGREAMTYYQTVFGGELQLFGYAEFGIEGPADGLMHGHLEIQPGVAVSASDAMPGAEQTWGGTRVYCSLHGDDLATLQGWFENLAADGSVGMPLKQEVWGDVYGLVKDKYGIEWMFNVAASQG